VELTNRVCTQLVLLPSTLGCVSDLYFVCVGGGQYESQASLIESFYGLSLFARQYWDTISIFHILTIQNNFPFSFAQQNDFPSSPCVRTCSGAHPASCTMVAGGPFPGDKARPERDADLMSRSRMRRSYTVSPQAHSWRIVGMFWLPPRTRVLCQKAMLAQLVNMFSPSFGGWALKFRLLVHRSTRLVPILSQFNPVY
jgi:hypothetical protein